MTKRETSTSEAGARLLQFSDFIGRRRHLKERANQLNHARRRITENEEDGVRIIQNGEINRLQLVFPTEPNDKTRSLLKQHGFRWSAWQREYSATAIWAAEYILKQKD